MPEANWILLSLLSAYALIIDVGGWLVLDTRRRQSMQQRVQRVTLGISVNLATGWASFWQCAGRVRLRCSGTGSAAIGLLVSYKWHALAAMLILLIPAAATLFVQPVRVLGGYDDMPPNVDPVPLPCPTTRSC